MGWSVLKKRVIPTLLLSNGRMVKGRQFKDYRDTGDPVSAAKIYNAQYADELIFIDINSGDKNRKLLIQILEKVASECFMPLTIGGGIDSVEDVRICIVCGIDYRGQGKDAKVWINCGREPTKLHPVEHAHNLANLGAGEIFLNSIDRDGMMEGFDLEMASQVSDAVKIPLIICGGAGNFKHLEESFKDTKIAAAACSSLFHFGDNNPIRARSYLRNNGIPLRVYK